MTRPFGETTATAEAVERERVDVLYKKGSVALATVVVNAALLAWFLSGGAARGQLIAWVLALYVVTVGRAALLWAYRRRPGAFDVSGWERAFATGSLANGIGWGVSAAFITADLPSAVAVAFVIGGMVAGASSSTATSGPTFAAFSVPALAPVILVLLMGSSVMVVMGVMLLLFGAAMTILARQAGRVLIDSVRLRFENSALTDELRRRSRERAGRLQLLIDEAGIVVVVADPKTLAIVDASKNVERVLAVPVDGLVGRPLFDVGFPDALADEETWRNLIEGARAAGTEHAHTVPADLGSRQLELSVALRDVEETEYALLVFHDVTERRALEAQLAQSGLLASLGTLSAGVAHEVNNPLAYILGNLRFLRRELRDVEAGERFAEPLEEAIAGAERIGQIARDLMATARTSDHGIGAIDPREVIESCLKVTENELRHRAKMVLDLEPTPPMRADAVRINQVLLNLILNAVHALPEGDAERHTVTVALRHDSDAETVSVSVRDTGHGIDPAHIDRIFEPFFTTRQPGEGTGLGLSICHAMVTQLGGRLSVESTPGEGSCFTAALPAAPWPEADAPRLSCPSLPPSRIPLDILVVDDDEKVARSVRRLLRTHVVTIETHAGAALDALRSGTAYDAILCDVMMPEINGVEFYRSLSEIDPGLVEKLVFVTGGAFTQATTRFLDDIENPVLRKPFTSRELREALDLVAHQPLHTAEVA